MGNFNFPKARDVFLRFKLLHVSCLINFHRKMIKKTHEFYIFISMMTSKVCDLHIDRGVKDGEGGQRKLPVSKHHVHENRTQGFGLRTSRKGIARFWANYSKTSIFWLGGWIVLERKQIDTKHSLFMEIFFFDVNLQFFLERLTIETVRVFTDFLTRLRRDALGNQVSR